MDEDRLIGPAPPRPTGLPGPRGAVLLLLAAALVWLAWSTTVGRVLLDQPRGLAHAVVGLSWLAAGVLTIHRPAVATLAGLLSVTWLAATLTPAALMWHRGVLVHLLLVGTAWWPRTWAARGVLMAAYVASVFVLPWVWLWTTLALAAALLLAAGLERRRQHISVVRLGTWRWATAIAATALVVPPVLDASGAGPRWGLSVLLGYAAALVVVAVAVVLATRSVFAPWAPDVAVDLASPAPRELLERALAATRGDPEEVRQEAARALTVATRLNERLASRQAEVARTIAETEQSRRRLATVDEQERRALLRDLDVVAVGRLTKAVALLKSEFGQGPAADRNVTDEAVDQAARRTLEHLLAARDDLDALGQGLQPRALRGGIAQAIEELTGSAPVPVALDLPEAAQAAELPRDVQTCLYYVAAEALSNVVKHAHAGQVLIRLRRHPEVELVVADDGAGGASIEEGTGLAGIRDRVEEVGGRVVLTSPPRGGTRLVVSLGPIPGET